jgi:hypothetical protein
LHVTYSRSHGGQLSIGVICWCDFDDIGGDQVDAFEAADDSAELTCSPTTGLGSAGSGSNCSLKSVPHSCIPKRSTITSWVKCIDVDTQVYRLGSANPVPDLLDDTVSANLVHLPGLDNLEATVAVVLVVGRSG